jgi:hypothetical protein
MADAEVVGLGLKPWVGHLETLGFWGRSQENCTLARSGSNAGTPLAISLWWLECVDDELSALAVKISLSPLSGPESAEVLEQHVYSVNHVTP